MQLVFFSHFLEDKETTCVGIEAGGLGLDTDKHGCSLEKGSPGIFTWSMLLFTSR